MPIQSGCPSPVLISKIRPHTLIITDDAYLYYRAISHFTTKSVLQGRYLGCSVLSKNQVDDVHSGGEGFLDAPFSFTLGYPSSFAAEFLQRCPLTSNKAEQQLHNHYCVLKYSP